MSYSIDYLIIADVNGTKKEISHEVKGYITLEALKADYKSVIKSLCRVNQIPVNTTVDVGVNIMRDDKYEDSDEFNFVFKG